jgi:hypothetical protein
VSIGASGAPTILNGKGVTSITRNSAGNYSILLKDNFNVLLDMDVMSISGSSAPAAPVVGVVSETVTSTKIVRIQMRDLAGSAADPASGEVLMIRMTCRNAST